MNATNIIFDLDGTLVDSVPGIQWSAETAMRNCAIARPCPDLTPFIGPPIRTIFALATGTDDPRDLDRLEKAFRVAYDTDGWRRTVCQPGTNEMLAQLQSAGAILWVVTNKPAHATQLILRELNLAHFFHEIVSRDSATPPYPSKGAMLTDLLERRALPPDESILVGDTLEDCHAAAAAGIACAVVPHGYGREMDGKLPEGSLRIAGWPELLDRCIRYGTNERLHPAICFNGEEGD